MNRFLKIIIVLSLLFAISCSKSAEDPLILPPNFSEMPDLNNVEQKNEKDLEKQQEQEIKNLKELLLKSNQL